MADPTISTTCPNCQNNTTLPLAITREIEQHKSRHQPYSMIGDDLRDFLVLGSSLTWISQPFYCLSCGKKLEAREKLLPLNTIPTGLYYLTLSAAHTIGWIFLSSSQADDTWAQPLAWELIKLGHNIWYDNDAPKGDDRILRLARELEQRPIFLIIVSPDSMQSEWVLKEIGMAEHLKKKIVSIIYRPALPKGFLGNYPYINAQGKSPQETARLLGRRLPA